MNRATGSSSSHLRLPFDVFLSFRGEDTRSNFTSHLHMALCQKGINVFIDDDKLPRGEEICTSLLKAIEESKISIVIISENYASSHWCLDELMKIIMCNKSNNRQVVFPVFYKVDPSHVRRQRGVFGEEFAKLQVRFSNKMQAWSEALTFISTMSGWDLKNYENEASLIQIIVQEVRKKLKNSATTELDVAKYPVGIDIQVSNLLPHVMSNEITMVGLYGIGGMGKTTLAKALYNKISDDFEGCCFLANVREASNQYRGLVELQKTLIREILMDDSIKVSNVGIGISIIRDRLCSKKIILILDDIDTHEQLQALAGGHDWFGHGSKVIATTRNKQLLASHGFNILKRVNGLNAIEGLELFSWHAFKNSHPSSDYLDVSKRAVHYCKGLPLALEVLGSFLNSIDDQSKFERILDEYENSYLDKGIQDILRISYDELEQDVKEIFLYISCCFVHEDKNEVQMMLKECDSRFRLEMGIKKLTDLSLLTIDKFNRVEMHDLIQQMGHTIHLLETSNSHKRKRLLFEKDVMDVLNGDMEARAVKVIKLNFHQPTELDIDSRGFEKVKNLVVLKVHNVTSSKSLEYLPSSLRWMIWPKFPFSSLPSTYSLEKLTELSMPSSFIKHFGNGYLNCKWLKRINLNYSKFLEEISDLSSAINLEELNLSECKKLVRVHESVGSLGKLAKLELSSHPNGFTQFPSNLKLKSLQKLVMYECRIVESYPHFSEEMKSSLKELRIQSCSVTKLSPTIGNLTGLQHLWIDVCKELTTLPKILKVPEGVIYMNAQGCRSLARFPDNIAEFISCDSEYVDGKYKQLILMNNCDIPEWFHFKSTNNSITFPTTFNYPGWKLKVLAACVKVQVHDPVNGYHRGGDLECEVFFKDILVWSSGDWTNYLGYDSRWLPLGASPSEYTWFIVLNPHRDFSLDDWDDMMERSPETDLSQLCFGINSMEMDRNRSNDKWNSIGGSIWKNFTVLFEPRPLSPDTTISIKGCGVHVIME
uniref:TIR-CC-NBS-AAA+ATPase class resistance protein n=1 Tax=Cucumis sativus TaxID=3659 RepID=D9I8I6_CUCSA|nr:TIR-CC-NBS-AAA+ATPase class resistance protein [Cucumis sativus]